jgi:pimeloyl-ACP methyl ester carboxylesterase
VTILTLDLADGRSLAWREFGDPEGVPTIAVHGSPDSSAVWGLLDEPARVAGVRVVAPDRPGFGASTPQPGRSILDWVDDHRVRLRLLLAPRTAKPLMYSN